MADLLKGENSGVIVDVRDTDFRAGTNTGLPYVAVNPSGDWNQFRSTDEWQRRYKNGALGYDTNSCTNFSLENSAEIQIERMLADGEIPLTVVQLMHDYGWFDASGNVNFNDWFNAITSGTTDAAGNTLYAPWDALRKLGNIAQDKGFQPNDFTSGSQWFGAKPTQAQLDEAKKFSAIFDIAYEWVSIGQLNQWDAFEYHLKHAPLHVLVPTRNNWNSTGTITNVGPYTGVNHAVTVIGQKKGVSHTVLDHYVPFVKTLAWDYYIPYALKGVVTLKKDEPTPAFPIPTKDLYLGLYDPQVKQLQEWLNNHGFLLATVGAGSPGQESTYFGDRTKAALLKYQIARKVSPASGYFGSITRAQMAKEA